MKDIVQTKDAPQAIGPYSQAVKIDCGNILFCSGQIPIDPATGAIVGDRPAAQARQVMENLKALIEAGDFSLGDVVKTTIYLTDMSAFSEINSVYESYFTGIFPARSTIEVSALPRDVLIEIDAIACK